jgi:hypothetical protein
MEHMLKGAYDLHVHTSPDVVPRKCSDIELGRRLTAAGMAGCAIKSHYFDTAARAGLLQEQFPQLHIVGGVVLNRSVGGINPEAVERSAQAGGKMVWFPTVESRSFQAFQYRENPSPDLSHLLTVLDGNGTLIPQAKAVIETAARHNMVVGTGHLSAQEGMALVAEAARAGCRIVLTHADNPADRYTIEQQREAVLQGAFVEHCFFTTYFNRTPIEEIAAQIRAVGCGHIILTTDFGQPKAPNSDEGMAQYASLLLGQGFSRDELRQMMVENPAKLILK